MQRMNPRLSFVYKVSKSLQKHEMLQGRVHVPSADLQSRVHQGVHVADERPHPD